MTAPRVRFAPSPTGPLHVGSARTALLNWLFARSRGGHVLLRIDDTDRERSDQSWEREIIDGLGRLGLDWDDGPLRQSERSERYRAALEQLPVERKDDAYVFDGRVIARADGSALYHLATAVDDLDDGITDVLRGRDHQSNTELQSKLIEALGGTPPRYVHAPLLVAEDRSKLSKRSGGAVTVAGLFDDGFLPEAVINALALSLADYGTDEIMRAEQLVERFEPERLHTADSRWDADKLRWINGQHLRALPPARLRELLQPWIADDLPSGPRAEAALEGAQSDGATLVECAGVASLLLSGGPPDAEGRAALETEQAGDALARFCGLLGEAGFGDDDLTLEQAGELVQSYRAALKDGGIKLPIGLKALRARLTGQAHGPELRYVVAAAGAARLRKLCRP